MNYEIVDTPSGQHELKESLQRLFLDCYHKPLADDWWEFLYLSSPRGCAISITAKDDLGLCGHYAFLPMEAKNASGQRVGIARGMTLAIAERARSRGVLHELLRRIRPAALARGLRWTIGFPNELSWRPLVMFCGWRVLHESPMIELNVPEDTGSSRIEETATLPPDGFSPSYTDPVFMEWRSRVRRFRTFLVDDSVAVVAKVLHGDTLDVMDAWRIGTDSRGSAVFSLARSLSLTNVSITQRHATEIGLDTTSASPTGYTVRQAVMANEEGPPPPFRFSLLFSDVY